MSQTKISFPKKNWGNVVLEHYISSANNWIVWRRFSGFSALSSSHLTWLVLGKRPGLYTMGRLVSEICHLFSLLSSCISSLSCTYLFQLLFSSQHTRYVFYKTMNYTKGQKISEAHCIVFICPQNERKYFSVSDLAS